MAVKMIIDERSDDSDRRLLLIHGRDFKPGAESYRDLSMAAMRSGIERDFPDAVESFDVVQKELVWYGDLNAEILKAAGKHYDEQLDVSDRRNVLTQLREIRVRKKFGIRPYDQLPGKSALPEAIADVCAPLCQILGLTIPVIRLLSRDFARYFDRKSDYCTRVRERLRDKLIEMMQSGDQICLISHGSGSVIAYDVLWQLSHDPDYSEQYSSCKIDLWLTLGSPLGDSTIKKRLLGSKEKMPLKFPVNVVSWHNVSAEDDYTCHDNTLADDYRAMLKQRQVSAVHDYQIFNLAVRYGKSNPHSSLGYYIHPRVSKILNDWLSAGATNPTPKYTF